MTKSNAETPREKEDRHEAQEANQELKKKFEKGEGHEPPVDRPGGIRGNPS